MQMKKLYLSLAAAAASATAQAGTDVWFVPLTNSAPVVTPNHLAELTAPFVTPAGIRQWNIVSLREVEDQVLNPLESILRVPAGTSSSMFDMLAYDDTGSYIFIPHETPFGAGASRHEILTRTTQVLFRGDQQGAFGNWATDYGAFDPCIFTPNATLFLAEEWTAEGRVIEVLNPFAAPQDIKIRELDSIANVAHEGISFSKDKRTIYFIDEWNSGSIYKLALTTPGDYTKGQTFVLKVDAFQGDAAADWNAATNVNQPRTGLAHWVPLTDRQGVPLPGVTNPFRNGPTTDPRFDPTTRGGRPAADDVGGTPYGRPEDMDISKLNNGNEVLYIAVTSENAVYSFEILSQTAVFVRIFASRNTPRNLGYAPTTGRLDSPDNIALDALGNIYVIEDAPNGSNIGGDIWFARDVNNDGVAESIDHFLSVRADGCEGTGMIFNPKIPTEFVVAVQHPDSTDLAAVPNGLGDAVWAFELSNIPNQEFVNRLNATTKRPAGN